jgi:hypothetical protein
MWLHSWAIGWANGSTVTHPVEVPTPVRLGGQVRNLLGQTAHQERSGPRNVQADPDAVLAARSGPNRTAVAHAATVALSPFIVHDEG